MNPQASKMSQKFNVFSEQAKDSRLYQTLSKSIAADSEFAAKIPDHATQPVPNLLFAAVNYLLYRNPNQELARFFPNHAKTAAGGDAYPEFKKFFEQHFTEIQKLMKERLVQTNEVRRCALLAPAVAFVAEQAGDLPVSLIDVGTSSGLNLLLDRYFVQYSNGQSLGDKSSAVHLDCDLNGRLPVDMVMPKIAKRIGMDLNPVDLANEDEYLWTLALIWPDQLDRIDRFQKATQLLRQQELIFKKGSALEILPSVVGLAAPNSAVCLMHSFVVNQFAPEDRAYFESICQDISKTRDLWKVSVEWLGGDTPELEMRRYQNGKTAQVMLLATCHHHGQWLDWKMG